MKNEEYLMEKVIENLTPEEEEKLQEAHSEFYTGTDDDMPDNFEAWLESLDLEEILEIILK